MKRITVNKNQVALVLKNAALKRVLPEGKYWIGFGEEAEIADMAKPFYCTIDKDVLLQDEVFASYVTVVDIAETEIGLVFQKDVFKHVITSGRHLFWNGINPYKIKIADTSGIEIDKDIDRNILERASVTPYVRKYKIEPHEKGLMFVDGKFIRIMEPGQYYWWVNCTTIHVQKADMRQQSLEVIGQEILTKDKAQIRINFMVQYKISDVVKSLHENKEYEKQLYVLMQLALREYVGKLTLDELMENKDKITELVMESVVEHVETLGVKLFYCGLKDIVLPGEIKTILNQVLIAEKKAQANIITRREETASTRSLLNTAKLMEDNTMLYKLKEMEYVEKIAEKINSISVSGGGQLVDQLKQIFLKQ